jgi:hypothetical protein
MSENTNTNPEEREASPEEIKAFRENQHKHYKEQLPFLKTTLEYESLIANIEEARLKYYTMRMRIAQLLAPPPPEEPEAETEAPVEKKERKLKSQN